MRLYMPANYDTTKTLPVISTFRLPIRQWKLFSNIYSHQLMFKRSALWKKRPQMKKITKPTKGKIRVISLYGVLHAYTYLNYDVKSYTIEAIFIYGILPYGRFSPFRCASAIHKPYGTIPPSFIFIFPFAAPCKT